MMHYYQFNIADYRKDTAHLTPIEHYIYRQLIDWYYLDEKPIPREKQKVLRRLGLGSNYLPGLDSVLEDFFEETDSGFMHKRIEAEIGKYRHKGDIARDNGKKGGRPKQRDIGNNSNLTDFNGNIVPKKIDVGHFLYLIYDKKNHELKVGETKNLVNRRRDIKRPAYDLQVAAFWILDKTVACELEKEIINEYSDLRTSGDWFAYRDGLEVDIAEHIGKKTGLDNLAIPDKRELKANQEPITINHKPLTKNQEPISSSSQSSEEDHELAVFLWQKVERLAIGQKKPNLAAWANELRKMRKIDGRTAEEIKEVFIWANTDSFWQSNIRSPKKLREQFDHLKIKRKSNGRGKSEDAWAQAQKEFLGESDFIDGEFTHD